MNSRPIGERLFSFAVIADTHLNQNDLECNSPFEVNKLANARLHYVIDDLNSRDLSHVIHLGDIVHPVPSMGELYSESAARFHEQVAPLKHPLFIIPGNHDVGDKPIDWGPAGTVRQSFLDAWSEHFGPHYFKHVHNDLVCIGINAQVLGSGLPLEEEQNRWLKATLSQHAKSRISLFTHYPPFLFSPDEDEHYDNIGTKGRTQILGILEKHQIESLYAGHVHHFWYNRFKSCDCYLLPSTCFTRQDYSEMFRIGPADELGRNDADKLGYFLVHVHEQGQLIEMVRSYGHTILPDSTATPPDRLEPVNACINNSPVMGFDLRQDWCEQVQIPPSGGLDEFDRKWVRNDYGLLALWEMGVRHLRVPAADFLEEPRAGRLRDLQYLGFQHNLYSFGIPSDELTQAVGNNADLIHSWEIGFKWESLDQATISGLKKLRKMNIPLYASPIRTKAEVLSSGKTYYHVINHGLTVQNDDLADKPSPEFTKIFSGVVIRCGLGDSITELFSRAISIKKNYGLHSLLHFRLTADNPAEYQNNNGLICQRLTEAMVIAWASGPIPVYCDSFTDTDRGYFPRSGVLDRRYNPKPGFHIVKNLHALIQQLGAAKSVDKRTIGSSGRVIVIRANKGALALLLPGDDDADFAGFPDTEFEQKGKWIDWQRGVLTRNKPELQTGLPLACVIT
ncbi:MAG: metallophosphoesterase family protein [bacterium]